VALHSLAQGTATDFVAVSEAELKSPPPQDWLMFRRSYDGWAHSPLDAINRDNVSSLRLAWARSMEPGGQYTTPLVRSGVMYVAHPGDVIQALHADSGDLIWEYRRSETPPRRARNRRNLALLGRRLFHFSDDNHLIALDAADGTLSFQYGTEEVSVATDSRTLFDDDRDDIEYLQISDLAVGDYLEVEALDVGGSLLATRVDRDETDDENELQAPVESFVDGISVTLLGVTFDVTQAEFENAGDDDISAGEFFANLSIGALVSVSDDAPGDGFAESVEFEFALSLDGDRDFIDDDEERIPESELPENARAFLEANYPGRTIAFIERDDDEIEVYLTDGTEIVFSLSGTFLEADEDDDSADDESLEDNDDDSDADEGDDSGNEGSDDGEGDEDDESDEEDAEDSEGEESEEDLDGEADEEDDEPDDEEDP
jgi:hypothetical protein